MDQDRLQQIFGEARELPPGERSAFLDGACRGDAELRAEVESLLDHDDRAGSFMGPPARDKTIRLWDVSSGEEVAILRGHEGVASVVFSPDGTRVVSGSADRTIRLWNGSPD